MRLADWPRAQNRARINNLANGWPPYDESEVAANKIAVNYNDLSLSNISHAARRQLSNALITPDPLFTVELDYGPVWQRRDWASIIQSQLNKIIRGSLPYLETRRSVFALLSLHGIAPSSWEDAYSWCPEADGVEDILVPSNTLLSLKNLPFLARFRQYTGRELWEMTHRPQVDPGWNVPLVEKAVKWVDQQAKQLLSASWPETWSPEKMEERIKQDGGLYSSDAIPTVDCFEFLYWSDEEKHSGWRKKIILDAWGEPGVGGVGGISINTSGSKTPGKYGVWNFDKSEFVYDSEERANPVYCEKLNRPFISNSPIVPVSPRSVITVSAPWAFYSTPSVTCKTASTASSTKPPLNPSCSISASPIPPTPNAPGKWTSRIKKPCPMVCNSSNATSGGKSTSNSSRSPCKKTAR